MLKTIDHMLGWFFELANCFRELVGLSPALIFTTLILVIAPYITFKVLKGIPRLILLVLVYVLGLGFMFFILLSDGMSKQW